MAQATRTLSRRSLISSTAALAGGTAINAVVIAATKAEADPIFAAIEKHKRALADLRAAITYEDHLRQSLPDDVLRDPRVEVGRERELITSWANDEDGWAHVYRTRYGGPTGNIHYAHTEAEIEKNIPREMPEEGREVWLRQKVDELAQDAHVQETKRDEAGLTDAEERLDEMFDVEEKSFEQLSRTSPATIGGVLAVLAYFIEQCKKDKDRRPGVEFLATLDEAIRRLTM